MGGVGGGVAVICVTCFFMVGRVYVYVAVWLLGVSGVPGRMVGGIFVAS